ncbi:hypothetical protein QP445_09565 [Micrococcus luteus]|nr:hypothetical protein [Micrococcus luteus]
MGATNVAQVFAHWTHLGHREARLLAFLALVSLDAGNPPVYFGGWADAARAIGLDPEGNPGSARKNVRQAFQRLATAGALVSSGKAHTGRRAEYALTLDPACTVVASGTATGPHGRTVTTWTRVDRTTGRPVDKSARIWERETGTVPQRETGTVPQKGDRNGPKRETEAVSPRRDDEPHQEYREENIALDATSSTPASARDHRAAAAWLVSQPDQGRAALADAVANRASLPEPEAIILTARMAGWVPEAEEVPA